MSAIDQYKHSHLGFIHCPSTDDFVLNNSTRKIALYELWQDIPVEEKDFDGKKGDILLGGGSGEAAAFRVSIPEAFNFFNQERELKFGTPSELFKSFWSTADATIFCEGYAKLGWKEEESIEFWLAKNVCLVLIEHVDEYAKYKTKPFTDSQLKFIKA